MLATLALGAPGAVAQPASMHMHTESVRIGGSDVAVDVFEPDTVQPFGVAIVAHGFARDRSKHRALAGALAEAGIITVVPDLPHVVDLWGNGEALAALADQLADGALGVRPVPRNRLVLVGTSAGGLASVVAASRLPGIAGWVGLDPVDRTGTATSAASQLTSPAIVLMGGASTCNLFGSARGIAAAVPRLLRSTKIREASHCDFEGPTNKFCETMCGRSSPGMQRRVRDETVSAVVEILQASLGFDRGDGDDDGALPGGARIDHARVTRGDEPAIR